MPAKLFSELQDRLAYEVLGAGMSRTDFDTEQRIIAKQSVNVARELIYEYAYWPWSKQRNKIITTASYEDETVTVTEDSTTLTGASTVFTAGMAGRYFIHESVAYKIREFSSVTELFLESPYVNTTASGESYYICEPEYTLPYYVREITAKTVKLVGQDKKISFISEPDFANDYANPSSVDDPPVKYRLPEYTTSAFYSTGDVTMAATINVVGNGTSWDHTMIGRAFRVATESEIYRISDVTSTTALTLDRAYGGSNTGAGNSYEIDPAPCLKIWFYPFFTKSRGIEFWYWTKPDPLMNDADIDRLMPGDMHEGIQYGAEWLWYDYTKDPDNKATTAQQKFYRWLESQKKKKRVTQDRKSARKPHDDYVRLNRYR